VQSLGVRYTDETDATYKRNPIICHRPLRQLSLPIPSFTFLFSRPTSLTHMLPTFFSSPPLAPLPVTLFAYIPPYNASLCMQLQQDICRLSLQAAHPRHCAFCCRSTEEGSEDGCYVAKWVEERREGLVGKLRVGAVGHISMSSLQSRDATVSSSRTGKSYQSTLTPTFQDSRCQTRTCNRTCTNIEVEHQLHVSQHYCPRPV
jgi:hypothetical protein